MNDDNDSTPPPPADPAPGSGTRKGAVVLATLIVTSLALYIVGDRLTPCTSQARIQAFVVPVAAEVAGKVVKVYIRDNDAGPARHSGGGVGMMGRTSIEPVRTAGMPAASLMASSRSLASTT